MILLEQKICKLMLSQAGNNILKGMDESTWTEDFKFIMKSGLTKMLTPLLNFKNSAYLKNVRIKKTNTANFKTHILVVEPLMIEALQYEIAVLKIKAAITPKNLVTSLLKNI